MSISVIIPTYKATPWLGQQIALLNAQTMPPDEIIIIDSASPDGSAEQARALGLHVIEIEQQEFNHGGTRNRAAQAATGDILVFMTQDALPLHPDYLEALTAPLRDGKASAAYARQEAPPGASPLERFARAYNYPAEGHIKSNADLGRMGIKTYFFSDTASAVWAADFWAVGGYPDWVIVNEDMVLCAKLLQAGHHIAYAAAARVDHAHHYSLWKLFQRYFDIGVFMRQSQAVLVGARSGGEGLRFAFKQVAYLRGLGAWGWIPRSLLESPVKFLAFHLGKRHALLPRRVAKCLSGQKAFWDGGKG